ncbi:hypothetical protein M3Y97_00043700 [Aphelenchoides bicaudatus]|nr:hypothetical protein M3Y97_00043700 [Aphelenchoides bicaudatus]
MNGVATNLKSWTCLKCTLINNISNTACQACNTANPSPPLRSTNGTSNRSNDGLLQKFPLITNTVAKIDSAIDAISSQFNAFSERNQQFVDNWLCPKCHNTNGGSTRHCIVCSFDRHIEDKFFAWRCERCGLRQPGIPLELKCPLCRKKFSTLNHSHTMPDLSRLTLNDFKYLPKKPAKDDSFECAEIYKNIINFCSATNQPFIDPDFPHSIRSIGDLRALDRQDLKITWLRPENIITKEGRKYRWAIFNDPQPSDIEQGLLGNCWFMAALAIVATRPDILEKIFVTKEYSHYGVYQIRLCIDGIWKTVVVDDSFPCHQNNKMMIFGVGRNNQLWVSLIEKALAKIFGSYARLRAGRMHEGLALLTGYPCFNIDIDAHQDDEDFINFAYAQICSALDSSYLIGASCGAGRKQVDERHFKGLGLVSQHAYSILSVYQHGTERLIRLRNPHGTFVWSGIYGPSSLRHQQNELRKVLEPRGTESGCFWMPFNDFVKYFDAVDIACVNMSGSVVRYPLNIGWDPKMCGCVRLIVTEPTSISIGLFQKSSRSTGHDNVDLMILVHEEDAVRSGHPGQLVLKSERRVYDSLNAEGFLKPGTYVIYALSLSKVAEGYIQPGGFAIHTSKRVHTEILPAMPDALRRSLQELILRHGRVEKTLDNCVARILTTNFAGIVVMIDNLSSDHALQVQSDCQNSSNVLSTRQNLVAFDSVPPLHRQILTVLTHFENSAPFSVSHRMQVRLSRNAILGTMFPQVPNAQHIPGYFSEAVFALHGPTPMYA